MDDFAAKFRVGQIVHHRLFDYRGAIFDVDASFQGSEEWYDHVARSRPPKDEPWYHVLPHGAAHTTYVAERNLETDETGAPITHPAVDDVFEGFADGGYVTRRSVN